MPSNADRVVDRLAMPREAREALGRAVPTSVVRGIVSDYVRQAAPGEANKSLIDKLVGKFGP